MAQEQPELYVDIRVLIRMTLPQLIPVTSTLVQVWGLLIVIKIGSEKQNVPNSSTL